MDIGLVIIRVVHISAAVIAGGAAFFQLVALRPALATLDEASRAGVRSTIVQRWWKVVLTLIALLLITGMINFLVYKIPQYKPHPMKGLYHGLFGLKFIAALAVFHLVTVLGMPGPKFDKWRAGAGVWLKVIVALVGAIIILGAILNNFERLFPTG